MKFQINDYAKASIVSSVSSWLIAITFTLLSWWAVDLAYSDYVTGAPKPDSLLLDVFPLIAFLAFPAAITATVFGFIGLVKKQNKTKAILGIIIAVPLFTFLGFGFWVAANGGV